MVGERNEGRPPNGKEIINSNATRRSVYRSLASIGGYVDGLIAVDLDRARLTATSEDWLAWEKLATEAIRSLGSFRRAIQQEDESCR